MYRAEDVSWSCSSSQWVEVERTHQATKIIAFSPLSAKPESNNLQIPDVIDNLVLPVFCTYYKLDLNLEPRCEWHRGECDLTDTVQNGKRFKCKACYNAERYLQTSYKKNHRAHEWRDMSIEQRRELIVKNKDRDMGAGRGARRKFSVEEASNIQDSVKTGAKIPYMNRKEKLAWNVEQQFKFPLLYSPPSR